uniref:C3H1-type domain-containing protein n=1 Tax=Timema monikensis TaxID=170555 RepID=A0A7R9EA33_9NEOP|nr:unnamed protein product [Timema monikensis]
MTTLWTPWKRQCQPYNAEKLPIPLPIPHPAHIAIAIHNRDSDDPIPLDSELCQNILKGVEDCHTHHYDTREVLDEQVSRFRGGGDSSYDSVESHSSTTGGEGSGSGETPLGRKESYNWRHTDWGGAMTRRRNNSGSIRVDLASPEDVTLDTDTTRVVFSSYGTTNYYSISLRYLKEFRVEQCPLFLQHKCTQHRPFTCFHWHFMNQRRRRPVRKRDGSFNYSADHYCTKFDETTGLCPEGDECPFLHRTAGDTERRYHLRYYKTCMCVHDTDTRGFCAKNGPHCAFAHGNNDLRPAVYDIKELQALENPEADPSSVSNGPNVLDKERNLMNEDPKWQDTSYVLANYKTEPCKRPPRLCRQGYACPQYHNSRDKRRSPRKFKYRSTPCPNVKHSDEWGEPGNCDSGDMCPYCHTRTEQQFHPEIYKSTKCNDVQTAGYCPRGVFCAFAHVELLNSIRPCPDVHSVYLLMYQAYLDEFCYDAAYKIGP